MQVLTHLAGMPEQNMKWQVAAAPLASNPPIVRLLGYFTAGQTEKAASMLLVSAVVAQTVGCRMQAARFRSRPQFPCLWQLSRVQPSLRCAACERWHGLLLLRLPLLVPHCLLRTCTVPAMYLPALQQSLLSLHSVSQGGEQPQDAIWVVLKWDGLAPLALYPSTQQTSGIGLGRLFGAQVRQQAQ